MLLVLVIYQRKKIMLVDRLRREDSPLEAEEEIKKLSPRIQDDVRGPPPKEKAK